MLSRTITLYLFHDVLCCLLIFARRFLGHLRYLLSLRAAAFRFVRFVFFSAETSVYISSLDARCLSASV